MLILHSERYCILMPNNEPEAEVGLNCCASSAWLKDNTFLCNSHDNENYQNWIYETLLKSHQDICAINMDFVSSHM